MNKMGVLLATRPRAACAHRSTGIGLEVIGVPSAGGATTGHGGKGGSSTGGTSSTSGTLGTDGGASSSGHGSSSSSTSSTSSSGAVVCNAQELRHELLPGPDVLAVRG